MKNLKRESMNYPPKEILDFLDEWGIEVDFKKEKEVELALQFFLMTTEIKEENRTNELLKFINKYTK